MGTTRRDLILRSAALAGATWFDIPAVLADTVEASRTRFGGFDFGLQGHSLRNYPLEKAVEIIANDLHLHWVEFSRAHLPLQPAKRGKFAGPAVSLARIREVKQLLRKYDIGTRAHGVNSFSADATANRKVFELAKALGVRNLSAAPTPDAFPSLETLTQEFNIRIAIHNHGPKSGYPTVAALAQALRARGPLIGVCLDTGHILRSGEDPVKAVYTLKGRIYGVHLKDESEMKPDAHSVVLGKGHLDVEGFFRALRKVKFPADGALSLEYESEPENPLPSIRACLEVASRAARKAAGR
ncbi:MAG: sugar phosphate isomerase/epimerase [Armatimonadetes bacterium]|nr:sugar phosphate isomerase/epimerase [Armatimonadota bacterium]